MFVLINLHTTDAYVRLDAYFSVPALMVKLATTHTLALPVLQSQ